MDVYDLIDVEIKANKITEGLAFIRSFLNSTPPKNLFEKQLIAVMFGNCYNALKNYGLAEKYYQEMIDKYPQGRYLKDAEKMYESSQEQLEVIAKVELENQKLREKSVDPSTKPTKVTAPSSAESKGNK